MLKTRDLAATWPASTGHGTSRLGRGISLEEGGSAAVVVRRRRRGGGDASQEMGCLSVCLPVSQSLGARLLIV